VANPKSASFIWICDSFWHTNTFSSFKSLCTI